MFVVGLWGGGSVGHAKQGTSAIGQQFVGNWVRLTSGQWTKHRGSGKNQAGKEAEHLAENQELNYGGSEK